MVRSVPEVIDYGLQREPQRLVHITSTGDDTCGNLDRRAHRHDLARLVTSLLETEGGKSLGSIYVSYTEFEDLHQSVCEDTVEQRIKDLEPEVHVLSKRIEQLEAASETAPDSDTPS